MSDGEEEPGVAMATRCVSHGDQSEGSAEEGVIGDPVPVWGD